MRSRRVLSFIDEDEGESRREATREGRSLRHRGLGHREHVGVSVYAPSESLFLICSSWVGPSTPCWASLAESASTSVRSQRQSADDARRSYGFAFSHWLTGGALAARGRHRGLAKGVVIDEANDPPSATQMGERNELVDETRDRPDKVRISEKGRPVGGPSQVTLDPGARNVGVR